MMNTTSHATRPARRADHNAALAAAIGAFLLHATPAAFAAPPANALPTGGQVVAGSAGIAQAGSRMTITQATDKVILNWNTFNIGSDAAVTFNQPGAGSVALNRVLSSDPSSIYGRLSANGQVFLINPSGVIFGQGARVDVGGLVASTLSLGDKDFLAGNYRFSRDGATGSVLNQGEINARYVALLAPEVRNEGIITATLGTVALAGGEAVTLNLTGQDLVDIQVEKASIATLVGNAHLIQVDGGTVILSAQSANGLLGEVVNTGLVQANGITADGGVIRITASSAIENTGTLSANAGANGKGGAITAIADLTNPDGRTLVDGIWSAQGGSVSGDGGFIETSAAHLAIRDSATINTRATRGSAGQWLLDPYDFTVAASGGDITGAALTAALANGTTVTIETTASNATCTNVAGCGAGTGTGHGDINVNDNIDFGAGALQLRAYRDVNINGVLTLLDGTNRLDVIHGVGRYLNFGTNYLLREDQGGPYAGSIRIYATSDTTFQGVGGPGVGYNVGSDLATSQHRSGLRCGDGTTTCFQSSTTSTTSAATVAANNAQQAVTEGGAAPVCTTVKCWWIVGGSQNWVTELNKTIWDIYLFNTVNLYEQVQANDANKSEVSENRQKENDQLKQILASQMTALYESFQTVVALVCRTCTANIWDFMSVAFWTLDPNKPRGADGRLLTGEEK